MTFYGCAAIFRFLFIIGYCLFFVINLVTIFRSTTLDSSCACKYLVLDVCQHFLLLGSVLAIVHFLILACRSSQRGGVRAKRITRRMWLLKIWVGCTRFIWTSQQIHVYLVTSIDRDRAYMLFQRCMLVAHIGDFRFFGFQGTQAEGRVNLSRNLRTVITLTISYYRASIWGSTALFLQNRYSIRICLNRSFGRITSAIWWLFSFWISRMRLVFLFLIGRIRVFVLSCCQLWGTILSLTVKCYLLFVIIASTSITIPSSIIDQILCCNGRVISMLSHNTSLHSMTP